MSIDNLLTYRQLDDINIVRISGGEPTLLENLSDYCKRFKDKGIKVILQTNGTAPLSEYTDTKDIVDEIWVSFYGESAIHNFITMDNTYYRVRNNILSLCDDFKLTIQSPIFNEMQLASLFHEIHILNTDFDLGKHGVRLRLFALLNHGKCNFALPINEQIEILQDLPYRYPKTEITCSLDHTKCNYENKLVLKPDGTLFNCASHKHEMKLCKR